MANAIFTISLVSFSAAYLNRKFNVVDFDFLSTCLVVFSVQAAFYAFYLVAIYPRFFHPLRYVPRATVRFPVFLLFVTCYLHQHLLTNSGQDCHPLWGHTSKILSSPLGFSHAKWIEEQQGHGDFLYSSFAGSDRLVAASLPAAAAVLQCSAEDMGPSTIMARLFERVMGRTLLTASGAEHKVQLDHHTGRDFLLARNPPRCIYEELSLTSIPQELRKSFWPAFAPDNIRKLSPNIWNASLRLRDAISNANFGDLSDGVYRRIDFWPLVHDGAMRVILEIALSIDLDNDPMGQELLECYHDLLPLHQDPSIIRNMIVLAQGMLLPLDWAVASNRRIRTIYEGQQTASRIYRALAEKRLAGEKSPDTRGKWNCLIQNPCSRMVFLTDRRPSRQNVPESVQQRRRSCGSPAKHHDGSWVSCFPFV